MCLRQLDDLLRGQEGHLPLRHPGRLHPVAGVGEEALLLDGHLEDAPQRAVVAVDRAGGDAGRHLVVQPVLDLVGPQSPDAVGTEAGQHVAVQVTAVGLNRRR